MMHTNASLSLPQAILIRMYIDGPVTHGILRKSANAQKVRELKLAIDNGKCSVYVCTYHLKCKYKNVNIYIRCSVYVHVCIHYNIFNRPTS